MEALSALITSLNNYSKSADKNYIKDVLDCMIYLIFFVIRQEMDQGFCLLKKVILETLIRRFFAGFGVIENSMWILKNMRDESKTFSTSINLRTLNYTEIFAGLGVIIFADSGLFKNSMWILKTIKYESSSFSTFINLWTLKYIEITSLVKGGLKATSGF